MIQGVAADIAIQLATEQPPEIVERHPQAVERGTGTGKLEQFVYRFAYRIDGADTYGVGDIVLAAPGKQRRRPRVGAGSFAAIDVLNSHKQGFLHAPGQAAISETLLFATIRSAAKRRQPLFLTHLLELEHAVERFCARFAAIGVRRIKLAPLRIDLIGLAGIV